MTHGIKYVTLPPQLRADLLRRLTKIASDIRSLRTVIYDNCIVCLDTLDTYAELENLLEAFDKMHDRVLNGTAD